MICVFFFSFSPFSSWYNFFNDVTITRNKSRWSIDIAQGFQQKLFPLETWIIFVERNISAT